MATFRGTNGNDSLDGGDGNDSLTANYLRLVHRCSPREQG